MTASPHERARPEPLGFVGLGTMGAPIARRLLGAGYEVVGTARARHKVEDLLSAGLAWADDPAAVARATGTVFCMLRDPQASAEVLLGADGVVAGLRPGALVVDLSTADPAGAEALRDRVRAAGGDLLVAPVTGTPRMAAEGQLSVMVGGDERRLADVADALSCLARSVVHVGGPAQAALLKLAVNLSVAIQFAGFAEGVLLAEEGGVSREVAVRAFLDSALASPMLRQRAPFVLEMPPEPLADVALLRKDLGLALEAARRLDVALPLSALAAQLANAVAALGHEGRDIAALWAPLSALAGHGGSVALAGEDPPPPE